MHIPLRVGLLDSDGNPIALSCGRTDAHGSCVLDVMEQQQDFVFNDVNSRPVPSLLRGFSAPVVLDYEYDDQTLAFLFANDTDSFNRWEAGQRLASRVVHDLIDSKNLTVPEHFIKAYEPLFKDEELGLAYKAVLLDLPGIKTLSNEREIVDVQAIDAALRLVKTALATRYQSTLQNWVTSTPNRDQLEATSERSLANKALSLLSNLSSEHWEHLAEAQYENATNMTDRIAALSLLCNKPGSTTDRCVSDFYQRWSEHKLVVDKWFTLQAIAQHDQVIDDVIELTRHEAFDTGNPNRLRSLIGAFASSNPVYFHASSGAGYKLLAENIILLDITNPQVAARLVTPFLQWRRYAAPQQQLMRDSLELIAAVQSLSPAVYELVNKALED